MWDMIMAFLMDLFAEVLGPLILSWFEPVVEEVATAVAACFCFSVVDTGEPELNKRLAA